MKCYITDIFESEELVKALHNESIYSIQDLTIKKLKNILDVVDLQNENKIIIDFISAKSQCVNLDSKSKSEREKSRDNKIIEQSLDNEDETEDFSLKSEESDLINVNGTTSEDKTSKKRTYDFFAEPTDIKNNKEEKADVKEKSFSAEMFNEGLDKEEEKIVEAVKNLKLLYYRTKTQPIELYKILEAILLKNKDEKFYCEEDVYKFLCTTFNVKTFNKRTLFKFLSDYFDFNKNLKLKEINKIKELKGNIVYYFPFDLDKLFQQLIKLYNILEADILYEIADVGVIDFYSSVFNEAHTKHNKKQLDTCFYAFLSLKEEQKTYTKDNLRNFRNKAVDILKASQLYEQAVNKIDYISVKYLNLEIKNLITNETVLKKIKIRLKKEEITVKDLAFISSNYFYTDLIQLDRLLEVVDVLAVGIDTYFHSKILEALNANKESRAFQIIKEKANGFFENSREVTLESLGMKHGVTRERIRQIEKKSYDKLMTLINGFDSTKINSILKLISNNNVFIDKQTLVDYLGDNGKIIYQLFYKLENERVDREFGLVYITKEKLDFKKVITDYLIDRDVLFDKSELNVFLSNLKSFIYEETKIMLSSEIIRKYVEELLYFRYGFYSNKPINRSVLYGKVVEEHFPDGIKVYDDDSIKTVKNILAEVYEDETSQNIENRSIGTVISYNFYLIDRGTYATKERAIVPYNDVLEIIKNYIESENKLLMISGLFEKFKEELRGIEIMNAYHLFSNLKYYNNSFYFSREFYVAKNSKYEFSQNLVEDFLRDKGNPVTKKELFEYFKTLTHPVVYSMIYNNDRIFRYSFNEYVHSNFLNLEEDTLVKLRQLIDTIMKQNDVITQRQLYEHLQISHYDIVEKYNISNEYELFSYIIKYFNNEYHLKRPYLSLKSNPYDNKNEVIDEYFEDNDSILISDLKEYLEDRDIKVMNMKKLLEGKFPEFIRVDQDTLIQRKDFSIEEEEIINLKSVFDYILQDKNEVMLDDLRLDKVVNIRQFKINSYLISAIVKLYLGNEYETKDLESHYNATKIVIRRKG